MQWYHLEREPSRKILGILEEGGLPPLFSGPSTDVRTAKLPFYTAFLLYRVINQASLPPFSMDFLGNGREFYYLDGSAEPLYQVNDTGDLILNDNTILDYLALFVHYVPGPDGEMILIDSSHTVPPKGSFDIDRHRAMLYTHRDLSIEPLPDSRGFDVRLPLYYGGSLVNAHMTLSLRGRLVIKECKMILRDSFGSVERAR